MAAPYRSRLRQAWIARAHRAKDPDTFRKVVTPHKSWCLSVSRDLGHRRFDGNWTHGGDAYLRVNLRPLRSDLDPGLDHGEARSMGRLLAVLTRLARLDGRIADAVRLALSSLALGRQHLAACRTHGPLRRKAATVTTQLLDQGARGILTLGGQASADETLAREAMARIASLEAVFPLLGRALRTERAILPLTFRRIAAAASKHLGQPYRPFDHSSIRRRNDRRWADGAARALPYREAMEKLEAAARRARLDMRAAAARCRGANPFQRPISARELTEVLFNLATPSVTSAYRNECLARLHLRGAWSALAIHLYESSHKGRLPRVLTHVAPKEFRRMLLDPLTGKQLRYQRVKSGFVLWSTGLEGKPEGKSIDGHSRVLVPWRKRR